MLGVTALEQALLLLEDELGLPLPPIPRALAPQVQILAPGFIGTRADTELGNPDWFLKDLALAPADYLVTGCGGYGLNSYRVHYVLVLGPIAVFLELRAGGILADRELARARVEGAWAVCAQLISAAAHSPTLPGERLVAIETPADRQLGRLTPHGPMMEPSGSPLSQMLAMLD